jgi:hypothetical protein
MKKPNFFIVGAPKCGTTALSEYLRQHPNIFITNPKEPIFFADDMPKRYIAKTLDAYLSLYSKSNEKHYIKGEASVFYLYSSNALQNIYNYNQKAKIVAMLRNPIDLVHSLHSEYLFNLTEDVDDFEIAWRLQANRERGFDLPKGCRIPKILQYKQIAMLGKQVKKLMNIFPKEQVMLILFDDFKTSTKKVYKEVLNFLNLPDNGRTHFPRINENKQNKSLLLGQILHQPPNSIRRISHRLYKLLGIDIGEITLRFVSNLNSKHVKRSVLSSKMRKELILEFKEDIYLLERIIGKDLSGWLQ